MKRFCYTCGQHLSVDQFWHAKYQRLTNRCQGCSKRVAPDYRQNARDRVTHALRGPTGPITLPDLKGLGE